MPQCNIWGCATILYIHTSSYVASYSLIIQLLYPEQHYYLLQPILSPHNASVHNRVYDYLRLSFISTCVSYVLNILSVIFPLYLLVTTWIQSIKSSLLHDNLP